MTLSIPHTLVNNTNADATKVKANFDEIASYVNTNAILKDGTVAFTGIPTLPASDPTLSNHAVRKAYVDTKIATDIAAINLDPTVGGDLSGTASNAQIVAGAVGATELAAAVAGNGLTGGGGSALAVNVDNSTIEINADALRLKNSGITNAKVASGDFTNIKATLPSTYCGRITSSALQSLTSGSTWRNVDLDFEVYDPSGMHSTVSNTQRVTAPVAGFYCFSAHVRFTASGSGAVLGNRGLRLQHFNSSGTAVSIVAVDQRYVGNTTSDHAISISGCTYLAANEYVDLQVFQNSGYTLNLLYDADGLSSMSWHCVRVV